MPALAENAGAARQSRFGEAADHGGQQICYLNRAHQGAVCTAPGEGSKPRRFHVGRFIHPVGMCLLTSFSKAWGRSLPLSCLLIAQLPQQLHCGPSRPRLVSVEAAQAGDHNLLPSFHRIEQGGEPRLGLRQIDAAHDQMTI